MIDSKDIWEETLQKAKNALKKNDENYMKNKADVITQLAKDLENQGMPLEEIANSIVHALKDANVSKAYILETLEKKYKRHYNKAKEQEQLSENPTTIEEENITEQKPIEVAVTNSGQSVSEPEPPRQTPKQPDSEDIEILKDKLNRSEAIAKSRFEEISNISEKQRQDANELSILTENVKNLSKQVEDRNNQIKNLEQQLKTVSEKKRDMSNEIQSSLNTFETKHKYDPNKLAGNDNRVFDNTIVCDLRVANWIVETLRDSIVKHPKSYFLIQQDFGKPLGIRINYLKTDFVT